MALDDKVSDSDQVYSSHGVQVIVDGQTLAYLQRATIKYIEENGSINASERGFDQAMGPGAGGSSTNDGGGSYGGRAGKSSSTPYSGSTYGSPLGPTALGSGGQGNGGGAIKINVTNTIVINGSILANGKKGTSDRSGSSGGSIWIIGGTSGKA